MAKAKRSTQGGKNQEPSRKELVRLQSLIQDEALEEARELVEQFQAHQGEENSSKEKTASE
ncbi:hypothetical protein HH1059_12400 [Halorhodospira halochloris]|uniref:Mobile element protein n=1 Tax=Halorhodospira halochloris TaxID=1052 RepID=A0A2Z6EZI7_HALHR|nr:hypothetical protein [Halorhodospira halochloris]MBK1652960.1 hypothetical protein [Halorhodospira halochloris]BBE11052.1 hypothetical protein HH1059_12400 [Halorhodospira halochloris]